MRVAAVVLVVAFATLGGCIDSAADEEPGLGPDASEIDSTPADAEAPPNQNDTGESPEQPANETTPPQVDNPVDGGANETTDEAPPVIVAVLDSGIRADHETFRPGQIVAWKDFVNDQPEPYDDLGHGTRVASLVAGTSDKQTPAFGTGVQLAIAKTLSKDNGASWADMSAAIYWAVDEVGADIISISIYSYRAGSSALSSGMDDALEHARDQGVHTFILAGNGGENSGVPTYSWLHYPANNEHALIVGGANTDGSPVAPQGSMDPEVIAQYRPKSACSAEADCYGNSGGTSYSTPLVAGFAGALLLHADANDIPRPTPDALEQLIKRSAEDQVYPPNLEGYGLIDADALERAKDHLVAGTLPNQGDDGVNELYVETIRPRL